MIPFNKPYLTGKETTYIEEAVASGKISGNGIFTQKCQRYFENVLDVKKALLTTSCTDALEMCALLLNIKEGDEVIMPSYTFVSTANAFVLRGAKIVFADSGKNNPNMDASKIESLVTDKTKLIVVVHYAGVACEMDAIMDVAKRHNLFVVEDAAQAIDSFYKGSPLGSIGHLAAFSFHETKNIQCGEGGLLVINDAQFIERAEIIWEKGTNRSAFFRGEIDKYGWVDIGSSFLPSELNASFLWAQIENKNDIQQKRKEIWNAYYKGLTQLENKDVRLPETKNVSNNNGHMFYLICKSNEERGLLITHLKKNKISAVFHYISLHSSTYYLDKYKGGELPNSDLYSNRLLRLPMFYELRMEEVNLIVQKIIEFYEA
jgi:dTDP-4-amino-4,6-dideoxygalactose transaminase